MRSRTPGGRCPTRSPNRSLSWRKTQGIAFGAPDGKLTTLFFLTASQDDRHHLHVLARLCRMLHDEDFVARLEEAETPAEIIELLTNRESEVLTQ